MKKIIYILILLAVYNSCKKDTVVSWYSDNFETMEEYFESMEKAKTDKEIIEAIDDYRGKIKKLAQRGQALKEEIKKIDPMNPPEELQDQFDKSIELMGKFVLVKMKLMRVSKSNPNVVKAQRKLTEAQGKISQFYSVFK